MAATKLEAALCKAPAVVDEDNCRQRLEAGLLKALQTLTEADFIL